MPSTAMLYFQDKNFIFKSESEHLFGRLIEAREIPFVDRNMVNESENSITTP